MNSAYPEWVCYDCASQAAPGRCHSEATSHVGTCDICGKHKPVTQPRDYGYPDFRPLIEKLAGQKHETDV